MVDTNKYKSPKWQKKRLEILESKEFKCEWCKSEEKTLNVHHITYDKYKDLWDYEDHKFMVLCEKCHKKLHQYITFFSTSLSILTPGNINKLFLYALKLVEDQEED